MIKRTMDICGAAVGLIVFSPILVVISLMILREVGSPVFFRQTRPGHEGKPFQMIKFRTMRDAFDADGNALPDADRLTRFGRFLRSSSLDELPELWNVLKGEMSLVGPRPLAMAYLPLYTAEQIRRHEVKPGITGWAQVNGRNSLTWSERFAHDVWYVDNRTIRLDVWILLITVKKIMSRDDVHVEGQSSIKSFDGTN